MWCVTVICGVPCDMIVHTYDMWQVTCDVSRETSDVTHLPPVWTVAESPYWQEFPPKPSRQNLPAKTFPPKPSRQNHARQHHSCSNAAQCSDKVQSDTKGLAPLSRLVFTKNTNFAGENSLIRLRATSTQVFFIYWLNFLSASCLSAVNFHLCQSSFPPLSLSAFSADLFWRACLPAGVSGKFYKWQTYV